MIGLTITFLVSLAFKNLIEVHFTIKVFFNSKQVNVNHIWETMFTMGLYLCMIRKVQIKDYLTEAFIIETILEISYE